ncbi:hypothetical protein J6590_051454 [Homalodisca vitripennis]|nr:hypothetical protein J6590_051454 [Homalodisca vitripennis]
MLAHPLSKPMDVHILTESVQILDYSDKVIYSTKDPSLPIQNSDHAMLARCAALSAACSFRKKKLTRACKVQAQHYS